MAVAHYLEALGWQREYIKMHAVLGGKNPHPQTYLVGGMALPVNTQGSVGLTPGRIAQLRNWSAQALEFVSRVYIPDLLGGATVLEGAALALPDPEEDGALYCAAEVQAEPFQVRAVPYCTWDNREPGQMLVWLREGS